MALYVKKVRLQASNTRLNVHQKAYGRKEKNARVNKLIEEINK